MTQVDIDELPLTWANAARTIAAERLEAGSDEAHPAEIERLAHAGLLDEQDTLR